MTLAVAVPVLGNPSETFLRRHVAELAPGRTVVVARRPAQPGPATWSTEVPLLWLDDLQDEWGGRREQDAVAAFLDEHGVQAVLLEYLDIWLPFLPLLAGTGIRTVAHAHGYDVSQRLREDYWRTAYLAYQQIEALVTMSQTSRRRLLELGLPDDLVHVVPYGVDVPAAVERPPTGPLHVLAAGRLVAKKDPLATIEACRLALAAGADLRLTVLGDGPLRPQVESHAAGLPVEVRGAARHSEVLAAMRTADVFCQHSRVDPETGDEEGLPVAVLEAMAHGLPVVSTRHAGIPEAVVEHETGLLVDEGDVPGMAAQLVALAADPVLRQRLGNAGRAVVVDRFSASRELDGMRRLLETEEGSTAA